MKDILLIPKTSGPVEFFVRGDIDDGIVALLQRIYVLLLSDNMSEYRDAEDSPSLALLLKGANIPSKNVLDAKLAIACGAVLEMLDPEDRAMVASFTGVSNDNADMIFTLTVQDGTEIQGILTNE